jgi:hypothetical protein
MRAHTKTRCRARPHLSARVDRPGRCPRLALGGPGAPAGPSGRVIRSGLWCLPRRHVSAAAAAASFEAHRCRLLRLQSCDGAVLVNGAVMSTILMARAFNFNGAAMKFPESRCFARRSKPDTAQNPARIAAFLLRRYASGGRLAAVGGVTRQFRSG